MRDLLERLLGYISSDVAMVVSRASPPELKLVIFWQNHVIRLLTHHGERHATHCWPLALRRLGEVRRYLLRAPAAVGEQALRENLGVRLAKVLLVCLNKSADAQDLRVRGRGRGGHANGRAAAWSSVTGRRSLTANAARLPAQVCVDSLRMQLADSSSQCKQERALDALHASCDLLLNVAGMAPAVRAACVPLADAVLGSLAQGAFAAALGSAALRERVGESLLAFLAACCAKAAGAAPQEHSRRDA